MFGGLVSFSISTSTEEEKILEAKQKPILHKLDDNGFGLYVSDDVYFPVPLYFPENCYPLRLYSSKTNSVVVLYNWEAVIELAEGS